MRARAPRRRRALALAAAAAALVGGAGAGAGTAQADSAGSATASSGVVAATLTWQRARFGVGPSRLIVARAGAKLFDASPFVASHGCKPGNVGCTFAPSGARSGPLQVVDLDGDGEPEVLVDAFTGGAHCCAVTEILRFTGAGYAPREVDWGDAGYELRDRDGDGRPEIVTLDDAFAGAFSSFAASVLPARVLHYRAGALSNVTRSFPAPVRANLRLARRTLHAALRRHFETLGAVAAITADLYSLGRGREVRPLLRRLRARKQLRGISGPAPRGFERRLLRFLHRHGYR
jgi:hypothetical protein